MGRLAFHILACLMGAFAVQCAFAEERTHQIESEFQPGKLELRVLVPDSPQTLRQYPVLYVLPVEAQGETRWGDPVAEIKRLGFADRYGLICVFPRFAQLPWYADHPTDPTIRQESYFLKSVLPLIEKEYAVVPGREGRLLLGFSKSGFGAWSLLLRHPEMFAKAAAFDAPLMQDRPDKYGMGPIFGSQENFDRYRIPELLRSSSERLAGAPRLILIGDGNFQREHEQMQKLLETLQIPHLSLAGTQRAHVWESGWVSEAVRLLMSSPDGEQ